MVHFHSVTLFGVDRITLSKNQTDDHSWITIDFGGGSSVTVFKGPTSTDWPEVVYKHHTITVGVQEETADSDEETVSE
jgi:hypothetical protein